MHETGASSRRAKRRRDLNVATNQDSVSRFAQGFFPWRFAATHLACNVTAHNSHTLLSVSRLNPRNDGNAISLLTSPSKWNCTESPLAIGSIMLVSASPKKDLWQSQLRGRVEPVGWRLTLIIVHSICRALNSPRASIVNVVRKPQNIIMTMPRNLTNSLVCIATLPSASLLYWESHVAGRTISLRHGIYWALSV